MSDRLADLIDDAFRSTAKAEKLMYAAGMSREIKDALIDAHWQLLKARDLYAAQERRRAARVLA